MTPQYPFPDVLDSSALATFKSCPIKFYYSSIAEFKPKGESVHLVAGGAFARGMEVTRKAFYEEGKDAETSIALGVGALLERYGNFQCPEDSAKSCERTAGAFEYYWSRYPLGNDGTDPITFPGGRRGIEFSFAQPLPITNPSTGDPIIYSGRMDAILNFAGGVFVTDEKTTSSLGASWARQWDLRSQFTGYCWGARENGIKTDGVLVRGISILKTKYETQQVPTYRSEYQIDLWYQDTLRWVEDIVECYKSGIWRHNFDHACTEYGGCSFKQVCQTADPTPWFETYFERRHWDPIAGKETLL